MLGVGKDHSPSIAAITQQQAVLTITAAAHLAEGGVFILRRC